MRRYGLVALSVVALAALAFGQVPVSGQADASQANITVDPKLYDGLEYRLVGHSRGGRVTTVTGVPSENFASGRRKWRSRPPPAFCPRSPK